ncbi:MAG: alpha/beta hydrolase [Proteobacteria bacterium]|nr:alpha/beta hydrolase [Pseudomonadota bacterium]
MRFLDRLAVLVLLAVSIAFLVGHPIRWGEAALMIWDIAAGGKPTVWQNVTDRPNEYPAHWADGEGDVYSPPNAVRAAMVLVPGAAVLGRDEPRLQALARTFARAGFVVLVPELPEVRRLALSRHDADRVASAMRQLRQWQPGRPLGVAAVSYAVAPAVIAALETNPQFIVGVGGYHDAEAAIRFVTTGAFRPIGDPRQHMVAPNRYGRWAFLLANAGRLDDPNDAAALQTIATMRLRDPDADVAARLGPDGTAVLALVENRDPAAVTRLIAALPERVRREIDGLNLALYDLSRLRCRLILVHGRGDPLVPYSESQALAAAASNARVSLFLVDELGHVDFNAVTIANAWTMWRAVNSLLAERR